MTKACENKDLSCNFLLIVQRSIDTNDADSLKEISDISQYSVYWVTLDALLFIVIVAGNILTILAVRLIRKLREVTSNLFVLNLAISDLMVGLTLVYHLAFYMYEDLSEHETSCIMRFVMASLACSSSMYSLITIAVDRYIGVVHPMTYARHITRKKVLIAILAGWFNAIAISTVPVYWNCFDFARDCEFETVLPRNYTIAILCPLIALIWTSMFVLYWRIWHAARNHTRRLRETGFDNPALDDCKGSKAVLSILGCFSVCWIPYLLMVCTRLFDVNPTGNLYKALFSLAMANSGMNPIIYAWKNSQFRRAFLNILCFGRRKTNHYNTSLNNYLERQRELTHRETIDNVTPVESM